MANRHDDLFTFQLVAALNKQVWELTARPPASNDQRFSNNIRDAANSAERNVPEGFARFAPGEIARFLDFSRASAQETKNQLRKGFDAGYFTSDEFEEADSLAARALTAIAGFQRYLRSPRAKRNAERIRSRSKEAERKAQQTPEPTNEENETNRTPRTPRTPRTTRTTRTTRPTGPFE